MKKDNTNAPTVDIAKLFEGYKAPAPLPVIPLTHEQLNTPFGTVQREGWVSVPIEPTAEMIESGRAQGKNNELEFRHRDDGSKLIYQAMLSAAPKE